MKFTVYSKYGCPYCTKVLQVLNSLSVERGYQVTEYVLNTHFSREEFYSEFGQGSTFPQVVYGDEHLGGCSDTVKYLKENNMI